MQSSRLTTIQTIVRKDTSHINSCIQHEVKMHSMNNAKTIDELSIMCKPTHGVVWGQPKINCKTPSLKEMKAHGKPNAKYQKNGRIQQSINMR